MTQLQPADHTVAHRFQIGLFRCVAAYQPEWDEFEVRVTLNDSLYYRFQCGPNLTLTQLQEYSAQKLTGALLRELEIVRNYAEDRWGKK